MHYCYHHILEEVTIMDSQSAIALDGGMEMAVSVPRHCHGPTVVAGAEDD